MRGDRMLSVYLYIYIPGIRFKHQPWVAQREPGTPISTTARSGVVNWPASHGRLAAPKAAAAVSWADQSWPTGERWMTSVNVWLWDYGGGWSPFYPNIPIEISIIPYHIIHWFWVLNGSDVKKGSPSRGEWTGWWPWDLSNKMPPFGCRSQIWDYHDSSASLRISTSARFERNIIHSYEYIIDF